MIVLTSSISGIAEADKIEHCILEIARNDGNSAHSALERLYLQTKDAIYGYALSILKNSYDAEDILHDCYISIYQSADKYVSVGKPMAWIFTITRNLCHSRLRGRKRMSEVPEEDWERYIESNEGVSMEDRVRQRKRQRCEFSCGLTYDRNSERTAFSGLYRKHSRKRRCHQTRGCQRERCLRHSCELDRENGTIVYEIEFKANGYEYEYDINAMTGDVVKHSVEKDD